MATTYNNLYMDIRQTLRRAGIEAATLEARELMCFASGKTRSQLVQDGQLYVPPAIEERARDLVCRHLAGEPVAYLIGEWEFYGLPLDISESVLIPRPDTETLVDHVVAWLRPLPECRVLDLCAGSGCIGLAIASQVPGARVVLGELDEGALRICRQNIRRNSLSGQVVSLKMDALSDPPPRLGDFDCLVCNPPYIPTGDLAALDHSVKDFEPMMALDGGEDGLDFYRVITHLWQPALRPGGHLLFEVGIGQAEKVAWLMVKAGYENIRITRDTGGIDRVVEGQRPKDREIPDPLHDTTEEEG